MWIQGKGLRSMKPEIWNLNVINGKFSMMLKNVFKYSLCPKISLDKTT